MPEIAPRSPRIRILDGRSSPPREMNAAQIATSGLAAPVAHHLERALELAQWRFAHRGWDGKGGVLDVVVGGRDASGQQRTASWNSITRLLEVGEGSHEGFSDFGRSFDVLAHELIHAVHDSKVPRPTRGGGLTGDIFHQAIRESWADVLASVLDGNFVMGEGLRSTSRTRAVRDLRAPRIAHLSQLSNASGGTHDLAGIASLAAVRAAETIGMQRMGDVWFSAMERLPAKPDYASAAAATITAAKKLFPSQPVAQAVQNAWESVGVLAEAD